MKKKFNLLSLNKKTISNLDENALATAAGGVRTHGQTCNTGCGCSGVCSNALCGTNGCSITCQARTCNPKCGY